ncbi:MULTISPECIES: hypothetical protein [Flavobacterium]|uniref:hypothetical protein n=1 Tax=Flavobacterium TaxID=237 RepID=UPI001FCACD9F|nr:MULTISPECIES: hypothetical protein [Flavobacterium]UOK42348.1 hypothetical protein LZF87_13660 [Flavobacterium enshiense]
MKNSIAIGNLKSLGFFCLALIAGGFIYSCSDDDYDVPPDTTTAARAPYVCTTCATTSQALPQYDNSARGIYKGVFSEGTFAINFKNETEESSGVERSSGVIYYKNRVINLAEAPEVLEAFDIGEKPSFILLRGMYDSSPVTLYFSVNENGSNPELLGLNIGGNIIQSSTVFKEKSNTLIEAYEGNYLLSAKLNPGDSPGPGSPNFEEPIEPGVPGVPEEPGEPEEPEEPGLPNPRKTDPGLILPSNNAAIVGGLRLIMSRSEGMWVLFKTMNDGSGGVLDHGSLESGSLMSSISGKRVAYLRSDEINFSEYTTDGLLFLHAERKR